MVTIRQYFTKKKKKQEKAGAYNCKQWIADAKTPWL